MITALSNWMTRNGGTKARSRDRGRRSSSAALGLTAALVLGGAADAQWEDNPEVVSTLDDSYVMLRMGASVIVAQNTGAAIEIHRLDDDGELIGPSFAWDPSSFELSGVFLDPEAPLVGCSLGLNRFALGYEVYGTGSGVPDLRVVFMRRVGSSYVVESGFPKSVGVGHSMRMVPNRQKTTVSPNGIKMGINGVMICWLHVQGLGPHSPVGVQQQGIRNDGTFVWNAVDGAYVGQTAPLDVLPDYVAHSIVSDGNGLAITTYLESSGQSRFKTTKLGASGVPMFSSTVPGQDGFVVQGPPGANPDRGACLTAEDGFGGAFYAFSRNDSSSTELVLAQIDSTGAAHVDVPWSVTPVSPLVRPLALVPARGRSVVMVYRDLILVAALKYTTGASLQWSSFLSGATNDNTEQADGVAGNCGVALTWTRFEVLKAKLLDVHTGAEVWGPNTEIPVNDPSLMTEPHLPTRPQIVRSGTTGLIVGWFDSVDQIRAERVRCADGELGL